MRLLITAGPTREYLDPVRYLSNASSGKLGAALAARARAAGHHVTLIWGPASVPPPEVDALVPVTSAADMYEAVVARFDGCDAFIAAAAVCDYRPVVREDTKIKKVDGRMTLELERTTDILAQMGKLRRRQTLVGFCLETEDLERRARGKLEAKQLDLVVANGPEAIGADTFDAVVMTPRTTERLPSLTKDALADRILLAIRDLRT
jgi:phosphopantothenoylcysteine decarboxylase / phosphopantothenate---cysteine ligase